MQAGHLLVQVLGQHIDLVPVLARAGRGEELDLGQRLVGEGGRHDEARMARRIAEVHQAALRQQDDARARGHVHHVDLRLHVGGLEIAQLRHLDLVVEVADVADDGHVLHLLHVIDGDDVLVAGGGDEDVGAAHHVLDGLHRESVHRRLQRADGVHFRHDDAGARALERGGRALAHVAIAADHGHLAGHHHIGAAADGIHQQLAAAVLVVELGLGDAVVDVDRREGQLALLLQLIEAVHAGGGLFRDALDRGPDLVEPARLLLDALLDGGEEAFLLFRLGVRDERGVLLGLGAEQDIERGVAAVVEDHVGGLAVRPVEDARGEIPVFLQRLALEGEDRDAGGGDRRGGMVLGGIDVARGPAHLGAQRHQRLDQHGGLDGHVQRARDAGAAERLQRLVFGAGGHEAGHLHLGHLDFLAAPLGQLDVGNMIVVMGAGHGNPLVSGMGWAVS